MVDFKKSIGTAHNIKYKHRKSDSSSDNLLQNQMQKVVTGFAIFCISEQFLCFKKEIQDD